MSISTFDLFKIGIGPSSFHTVGPMRAAKQFALSLKDEGVLSSVHRVRAEMFGSLGATGKGQGTPRAILLGLMGEEPETVDVDAIPQIINTIRAWERLSLLGEQLLTFVDKQDLILHRREALPSHPDGMKFIAFDNEGGVLSCKTYYSVDSGNVLDEDAVHASCPAEDLRTVAYPFSSGAELLALCGKHQLGISELMSENEKSWRGSDETREGLIILWLAMKSSVKRGMAKKGVLPGSGRLQRRAPELHRRLLCNSRSSVADTSSELDWVTLYALAVSEENAAGGRVVAAPTNSSSGVIPAVLYYYTHYIAGANEAGVQRFLLTAAAIGILHSKQASTREIGLACSMAAGALTEVMGGSPAQVINAAEIAMEHDLGLSYNPVGGPPQVQCIERNAMASLKAIDASRRALKVDDSHFGSLYIEHRYNEISRGGMALNRSHLLPKG